MQVDIKKVLGETGVPFAYKVTCTFANKDTYCFIDRCTESQIPSKLHKYLKVSDIVTVDQAIYSGTSVDTIQSGGAGISMILYGLSLDLTLIQKRKVFLALCGLIYSDLQLLSPCKLGTDESVLPLQIGAHFSYGRNLTITLKRRFTNISPYRKMLETMTYIYSKVPEYLGKEGTRTKKYEGDYSVTITSEKRQ